MKLAEALLEREDVTRKANKLKSQLGEYAKTFASMPYPGDYQEDLEELESLLDRKRILSELIVKTNSIAKFDEDTTLAIALTRMSDLKSRISTLEFFYNESVAKMSRYSKTDDDSLVRNIQKKDITPKIEDLREKHKQMRLKMQMLNWKFDLSE